LSRYVLDGLGLEQDRDFQAIYLERAGDGPAMVIDGRAAALWGGGQGWPGFGAVAKGPPARGSSPGRERIARILEKHAFLKPLTFPRAPIRAHGPAAVGGLLELHPRSAEPPDEVAYRLARALHLGEAAIARRLPQAEETTAANTRAAAPRPDFIIRACCAIFARFASPAD